jgi:arylsulfatase A-like enzyme
MRNSPVIRGLLLGFAIAVVTVPPRVFAAKARPNLILIEVDDLTYTYASAWGSKTARTPTLDRLAREGFVFDQAMCQGMMCGPSRNSLITGKYPHQLGFYQQADLRTLPADAWVLPAALRRSGYTTAWIGKSHLKPPAAKEGTEAFKAYFGFDHALYTVGRAMIASDEDGDNQASADNPYVKHLTSRGMLERYKAEATGKRRSTLADDDYLDGWFTRNTEDYIRDFDGKKPLFLWINYSVPHAPFDVPEKYHAPFASVAMPGLTKPLNYIHPESLIRHTKRVGRAEAEIQAQRGYHANIYFMDTQVGRILTALERRGILGNSWIVFFSDQGVMEGAQGLKNKMTLFRQITQPAMIIRPPGGAGGVRVAQPVELLDLLPTLLELAQAKGEKSPAGVSLLPLFAGQRIARTHTFGEIEDWIVASDGRYRLIKSVKDEPSLLFDDHQDPENLKNLAPEKPAMVAELSAAIDRWLAETGRRLPPRTF